MQNWECWGSLDWTDSAMTEPYLYDECGNFAGKNWVNWICWGEWKSIGEDGYLSGISRCSVEDFWDCQGWDDSVGEMDICHCSHVTILIGVITVFGTLTFFLFGMLLNYFTIWFGKPVISHSEPTHSRSWQTRQLTYIYDIFDTISGSFEEQIDLLKLDVFLS